MSGDFHPAWLTAPYPNSLSMPTPFSYKISVTEISESPKQDVAKIDQHPEYLTREVFAMAVDAADFNLQSFVQAITKTKRGRKARGKEAQ